MPVVIGAPAYPMAASRALIVATLAG